MMKIYFTRHTEAVASYKGGKENAIMSLVGKGMKASKGSANPKALKELLEKMLT